MANLIGFDTNRGNVEFKGHCKLSINFVTNHLYVEPKNEEFKLISSSFTWKYVMKKNLLFVFADFDFLDFCLEFKNGQICKKIFDYIASRKKNTEVTEHMNVDASFINPILQKIADNPSLNSSLINVMAEWIKFFKEDEKEKYTQIMTEYGIYDLIFTAKEELPESQIGESIHPKTSAIYPKIIPSSHYQMLHIRRNFHRTLLIFTSDQMDSYHVFKSKLRNDEFKCIACDQKAIMDIDENFKICAKTESHEHLCKSFSKFRTNATNIKIIQKPDYEFYDNCPGKIKMVLVIFDSDDRRQCYEYSWSNQASKFCCRGCGSKIKSSANIYNEGTEKEYVEYFGEHQCEKRKYSPEKYAPIYNYVLKPYFEIQKLTYNGKERQKLIIFDLNDRNKCYEYGYNSRLKKFRCRDCRKNGKFVVATLNQNSDGVEYIILSNAKHVCQSKLYVSTDNCEKLVLYQSQDFEILEETKNTKIFVFEKNDRKSGYLFYVKKEYYSCSGCTSVCLKKNRKEENEGSAVMGRLVKDEETGKYSFEMKLNQIHVCEPQPYQPQKYEFQSTQKTFDFFYYRLKNGQKPVKLAIQSPIDNKLCFTFVYHKSKKIFNCIECRKMKKQYSIQTQKDADGKENFNHDLNKHICKPIEVSSIQNFDILKEHEIKFESKPKIVLKVDESRVIKMPNFELRLNKNGVPEKKLVIPLSNDEALCNEFFFDASKKIFLCRKCKKRKTTVSAKLHKNDEESFIVMGKNEHVCQPVKYRPV